MSNYGIKISKPNYDVETCSVLNQIFNSEKNCIKLALTGTVSGAGVQEVSHGFSFTPGFLVWYKDSGEWYPDPAAYSNSSKLYIDTTDKTEAYYVIFADEGA